MPALKHETSMYDVKFDCGGYKRLLTETSSFFSRH